MMMRMIGPDRAQVAFIDLGSVYGIGWDGAPLLGALLERGGLILYDRDRFSTLRMISQDNFARKEEIPLEAVCGYIEARQTLHIEGDGRQSLAHAKKQGSKVRALKRDPGEHGTIDPYMKPIPVEGGARW
jgi:hypothetical protein